MGRSSSASPGVPLFAMRSGRSATVGWGVMSCEESSARSRLTIARSSSSVRTASNRMFLREWRVGPSAVLTWRAPAWTAMRLTWWETTSCISRAMFTRSSRRSSIARSCRSLSRDAWRSASRAASSALVRIRMPRATGPPAYRRAYANARIVYCGSGKPRHGAAAMAKTTRPASTRADRRCSRQATEYKAMRPAKAARPSANAGAARSSEIHGQRCRTSSPPTAAIAIHDSIGDAQSNVVRPSANATAKSARSAASVSIFERRISGASGALR